MMTVAETIRDLETLKEYFQHESEAFPICLESAIEILKTLEVVRCSECRWARPKTLKGETGYRCIFYRVNKAHNGFCDCGERIER